MYIHIYGYLIISNNVCVIFIFCSPIPYCQLPTFASYIHTCMHVFCTFLANLIKVTNTITQKGTVL